MGYENLSSKYLLIISSLQRCEKNLLLKSLEDILKLYTFAAHSKNEWIFLIKRRLPGWWRGR